MKRNNLLMHFLLVVAILIIALPIAGCAGSGITASTTVKETNATTATETTTEGTPAAENKVLKVSGAVNNTFTPAEVEANNIMGQIVINLLEKKMSHNGIYIQFPVDTQPGTYTMVDAMTDPAGAVSGNYQWFSDVSGGDAIVYYSTKGTLTLTAVGSKFSGQFQFTAVDSKDASKTIEASGSFIDVPLNK